MPSTKDISAKLNLLSSEDELAIPLGTELMGQRSGGLSFFSDVFKRGHGSNVFGSDANGTWWGGPDYATGKAKIDYAGNAVLTSVTISGYIPDGDAAADVNAGAVTINGGKLTAGSVTATQIATNTLTVGTNVQIGTAEDSAGVTTIIGDTVNTGYINARNVTALSVQAGWVYAGNITAGQITGGSLAIGGSADVLGTIVVKNSSGTEIAKLNNSGIIVRNTRGLFFESVASGDYFSIQNNASSQAVLTLPNSNQLLVKNSAGTTNLFTISSSAVFSGQAFSVNAAVTCKELLLNYGQNEGAIRNISNLEGYNDLNLYGNGTIRLYPGSSKVWFDKNIDLNDQNLDAGNKIYAVEHITTSDRRLKDNIKKIESSLDVLMQLNPVSFNWKKDNKPSMGLIAQEVYSILPDTVSKSDSGYLSINYTQMIPVVIKAVQELYEMLGYKGKKRKPISEESIKLFDRTPEEIAVETKRSNPDPHKKEVRKEAFFDDTKMIEKIEAMRSKQKNDTIARGK